MQRRKTMLAAAVPAALALLAIAPLLRAAAPSGELLPGGLSVTHHDLSQIKDGESRTYGDGEHAFTAVRRGDEVTVTLPDGRLPGAEGERTITCSVGKESCFVMTHGDGRGVVAVLDKQDGRGAGGKERRVFVMSSSRPGEEGAEIQFGSEDEDMVIAGPGGRDLRLMLHGGDDGDGQVLRCPRGDTTMTLGKDEAATGYSCPRHGLPLEKAEGRVVVRKVRVHRPDGSKTEGAPAGGGEVAPGR